jgi:1,4-dihydroxy-6-naphthoate synthase
MKITIGHTPDMDDAVMFYAMLTKKIDTEGLTFSDELKPIALLNKDARLGHYDFTALSAGAFSDVTELYDVLESGACMAEERGPVLVFHKGRRFKRVLVPGFNTTAARVLTLYDATLEKIEASFDTILARVTSAESEAGLLVSEDQMCISEELDRVDLGAWWRARTNLPLPLGIDVVKRSLDLELKKSIHRVFRRSIEYALTNSDEVYAYAKRFSRNVGESQGKDFVATFVNHFTLELGERGKSALALFLKECHYCGGFTHVPDVRFINGVCE